MAQSVVNCQTGEGGSWELWRALTQGDAATVLLLITDSRQPHLHPNLIFDTSNMEEWKNFTHNIRALRLWSLSYRQEFTAPLHITASRGFIDCLRHLLSHGAEVDFAPGGKTALHEACENSQADCVRLLLSYGANPNSMSEDGYSALHLCSAPESGRCVELLLDAGARVDTRSEDKGDTALHVAARFGLEGHVRLLLGRGASVGLTNGSGETPLHAACSQPHGQGDAERYHAVCQVLVERGAPARAVDSESRSPLHLACRNSNHKVVNLLLQAGSDVNLMDYGANAPMHYALQAVAYTLPLQPEKSVLALLNHGAIRIWPGSLSKVLKYCAQSPRTIEVLLNVYDRVNITERWSQALAPEHYQMYRDFYDSLFSLAGTPRSLQHLCRCVIRSALGGRCASLVPTLPLPPTLHRFILLSCQGSLS